MKSPKNPAPSGESSPQKPQDWLSIRASAGSGKTFALTLRFVYLALLGAKISEILTITFTIKARTEMQERILGALRELSSDNYQKSAYFASLRGYGLGAEEIHTRARRCLDEFLHAKNHILTFDAFFRMVLERFSFYAGLAQNFETSSTQKPKNAAFEELLGAMKKSDFARLADFCNANDLKAAKLLEMIESQKIPESRESSVVDEGFLCQNIVRDYNNLRAWLLGALPKEGGRKITDIRGRLENAATEANCIKVVTEHTDKGLIFTPTMLKTLESLGLSSRVEGDLAQIKANLKIFFAQREARVLGMIARLQRDYERRKISALIEANRLGFDDVSFFCHKLLGEEGHIERDFFYFRLDSRIRHILVDEFQDTNARQLGILKPLIEEIKSGEGRLSERSLFFVGDEKQAIYGFRGSDSRLFGEAIEHFRMEVRSQNINYRSAKNIVNFVNETFAGRFKNYEIQEANSNEDGFVKIVKSGDREEALAAIKNRVDVLLSKNRPKIAILVRKNSSAREVRSFLLESNPRLRIALQTDTSADRELLAIANALKYIKSRGENIAKNKDEKSALDAQTRLYLKNALKLSGKSFFAFESQQAAQNEGKEAESRSLAYADSTPAALENISKDEPPYRQVFAVMRALGLYGEVALKLLETSCKCESVDDFLADLKSEKIELEEARAFDLCISTIHKSKGLEFGDVIVSEFGGEKKNNEESFFYDYKWLDLERVSYLKDAKARCLVDEDFAKIYKKNEEKKQNEAMNLLYVAFTRARESLFVVLPKDGGIFKPLGLEEREIGSDVGTNATAPAEAEPHATQEPEEVRQEAFGRQDDFIIDKRQKYSSHTRTKGIALHLFMEHLLKYGLAGEAKDSVAGGVAGGLDEAVRNIAQNRFGLALSEFELRDLESRARRILGSQILQKILAQSPKCRCEVSYLDESRDLKRIDCILETKDEAFILEYKSSKRDLEANKAQLGEYLEFARGHFGGKKVSGLLCIAENGEVLSY